MHLRVITCLLILSGIFLQSSSFALSIEEKQKAAHWNQQGIDALNENDYLMAIEYFHRAYEIMPENGTIRKNLAITYNNYGIALNDKNKTEDAKEFLYKAIELDNNNKSYKENLANIISNRAAEYYKNGNYDIAERELKESLSLIPKHVPSLVLLGQIYYQTQELARAEAIWQKAYNLDPKNKELRQMLAKLSGEKKVETSLKQLDAYYFDIRFDKEAVEDEIYDIKYYLQEAYRDIGKDFNYYPESKLPVILYTQEDFQKLRQTPEWIAGIYDGKIRLPIRKNTLLETEFKRLIWHEYTHAVVFDISRGNCPVWFNEGLAKYEEAKIEKPDCSALSNAIMTNSLIPLNQLNSAFSVYTNPQKLNLAYLEAYSFMDFTLDRWNFHVIKNILALIRCGNSLDKAFYEVTNKSMDKLDNDWKEYIQRNYCK